MNVVDHLTDFIKSIKTDIKGPVIIAVSGGPDSICLLHVLAQIRSKININIHVAHLNHLLRGSESDADAAFVSSISTKLGIPATIENRTIKRSKGISSVEEAARNIRYSFLIKVAKEMGSNYIAIAHTSNDQVETIFMNIIRGTGLEGLRGMKEISSRFDNSIDYQVNIIRPLLHISREDILQYCQENNLQPRFDSSNKSTLLRRNKFRIEILPELMKLNPRIGESLFRTSELAGEAVDYFNNEILKLKDVVYNINYNSAQIDKKPFSNLSIVLQKQIVRKILYSLIGGLTDIESIHINQIIAASQKQVGTKISLPYGLTFTVNYDSYSIDIQKVPQSYKLEGEYNLTIPGDTVLPNWRVISNIYTDNRCVIDNPLTGSFDYNKISNRIIVRCRKPGDRFQPYGMTDSKKLQDFMVDEKIVKAKRDSVPLVCSGDQIMWVVGYRIDDRVKISESTSRVLVMQFLPLVDNYH